MNDEATRRLIDESFPSLAFDVRRDQLRERAITALESCMDVFEDALARPTLDLDDRISVANALTDIVWSLTGKDDE